MKKIIILLLFLPAVIYGQTITPIANIQDSISVYNGEVVTIEGVITIGAGVTNGSMLNAFIQDDSGKGIEVFDYDITTSYQQDIIRGNKLRINGEIDEYQGVTEIKDFTYEVLATNLAHPFVSLTIPEIQNYNVWEGTFVSTSGTLIEDPYFAGGGYNITIEDDSGDQLVIRVWDSTNIDIAALEEDFPITAYGVVSSYESVAQILPGYQEDIQIDIAEPQIEDISWQPAQPFIDENIIVTASVVDYDGLVESVKLRYRLDSDETTYLDTLQMELNSSDDYETELPPLNSFTQEEDDYVINIEVEDDSANVVYSSEIIEVLKRSPIISNMNILNEPEPNDSILVQVNIEDSDGVVEYAQLIYTIDFNTTLHYAALDSVDIDLFEGIIPGRSSGETVHIGVIAEDDSSLVTIAENLESYTYPLISHAALLNVPAETFNPYAGETFPIEFGSESGDKVILRVYSSEGKLVTTLKNIIISNSSGINHYDWDGRDKNNNLLPLGLYICFLEVVDVNTGNKKTAKAPIVIGAPLK